MATIDPNAERASMSGPISWPRELAASVVVFFVAVPLCMGISVAVGVDPAVGLISGVIGGIVVGGLSGAPLQVSGPAAGLIVLCVDLLEKHGAQGLFLAVLVGGVLQAVAGKLRFGRWFRAVSPAVIQGMLAGIGVIILVSQMLVMFDRNVSGSMVDKLIAIPAEITAILADPVHHHAGIVGLVALVVVVLWDKFRPDALSIVPGPLLAVIAASGLTFAMGWQIARVTMPTSIMDSLTFLESGTFDLLRNPGFWASALGLAVIASAESLLCASAVDRLHDGPRTDYDKELFAQGIGNMIAGCIGGLPITGVIVRSSANVSAGARTRWSAVVHGFFILAAVAFGAAIFRYVPKACLAAILVYIGFKLAAPSKWKAMFALGKEEGIIFTVTVLCIAFFGLLTGVMVGLGLALFKLVYTFAHLEVDIDRDGDTIHLDFHGAATFLSLPKLAETLEDLPPGKKVNIHIGGLAYVDHACIELLETWSQGYESAGGDANTEWDELHHHVQQRKPLVRPQTAAQARDSVDDVVPAKA